MNEGYHREINIKVRVVHIIPKCILICFVLNGHLSIPSDPHFIVIHFR